MVEPARLTERERQQIGVVVIGRNEGERLRGCLESLREWRDRLVYVDSSSTDGSAALATTFGATVVRLEPDRPFTAARGRHAGVTELRARHPGCEVVQFIDGDCLLEAGWIESAYLFLHDHERVAVVCGRRAEIHPDHSLYNRMCDLEWDTPLGRTQACGGDSMMRLSAYEEAGGFRPELLAGEEPELAARLRARGWDLWRLNQPMTRHDAAISRFGQWWRRAMRGGFGYAQVWSVTGGLPQRVYGTQLRSALLWAAAVPLAVVLIACWTGQVATVLALPLLYSAQVTRMTVRRGHRLLFNWQHSAMIMLAKIPELIGATRFFFASRAAFDYKGGQ